MNAQDLVVVQPADGDLTREAALHLTEKIREATVRAFDSLADVEVNVEKAWSGRIWLALGYDAWDDYCEAELRDVNLWRTVEERHARTMRLRDSGLSARGIAAALGVGHATTDRDIKRLSTASSEAVDSEAQPAKAVSEDGKERPATRPQPKDLLTRRVETAKLAGQGLTQETIAARVGVSQGTVSQDLKIMAEFVEQAPPAARAALQEQDLSTAQMVAAFEMSTVPAVNLGRLAASAIRDLKPQAAFLHEQVVMADEWTDQGQRRRAIEELTPALADVMQIGRAHV